MKPRNEKEIENDQLNINAFSDSHLPDDEMDGTSVFCEPEKCLYCSMDGPMRNRFHVIGCPDGLLS